MPLLFDRTILPDAEAALALILDASTEYSLIAEDLDGRVIVGRKAS